MRIILVVIAAVLAAGLLVLHPLARPAAAQKTDALVEAIDRGDVASARKVIGGGVNVNGHIDGSTPLVRAVGVGRIEMVRELLRLGADVNHPTVSGNTALGMAVALDRVDLVRELLRAGADPSIRSDAGRTAFDAAKEAGNAEIEGMLGGETRE